MRDPIREKKGDEEPSIRAWIWIFGAAAVLAAGFHCSRLPSFSSAIRVPASPIDWTSPRGASLWLFLTRARDRLPAGASYTVQARDPDDEMNLYMLSLGLLLEQKGLPTSYYGIPTPDSGDRARFVLVFGAAGPRVRGRLVCEIVGGGVYERAS